MLLPWYLHGNPSFVALISKSKDGDLLAKLLENWNYKVIRGSSSTDGDVALKFMIDYAKNNYSIAITPDGPRGPAHKLKAGAIVSAKKSKVPLVLAGVGYNKKKILKSLKGKGGGFRLNRVPKKIGIADIIRVFQGNTDLFDCMFKKALCPDVSRCPLRKELKKIEKLVHRELGRITLSSLAHQA